MMSKKAVRSIAEATLKDTIYMLGVSQTTVAYYRSKTSKTSSPNLKYTKSKEKRLVFVMRGRLAHRQSPNFHKTLRSSLPDFALCLLAPDFVKKKHFLRGFERIQMKKCCFIFEN